MLVGHFFKKYLIVKNLAFKRGFHLRLHFLFPLLLLLTVDIVAPNAIEAKARGAPVFVAALRFPVVWTREPQLLENWVGRAGGDITGWVRLVEIGFGKTFQYGISPICLTKLLMRFFTFDIEWDFPGTEIGVFFKIVLFNMEFRQFV